MSYICTQITVMNEPSINSHKVINRRKLGILRSLREKTIANWCLKRSRLIYAIASRYKSGEVRINIAMRCRDDSSKDWGHAWVTCNGKPLWERKTAIMEKPKTMIADTGKFIYWVLN